jgi:hypothetical protein
MADSSSERPHIEPRSREVSGVAHKLLVETQHVSPSTLNQGDDLNTGESPAMIQVQREQCHLDANYWLQDQGAIYPLKTGVNSLGRLRENDVVIPELIVSRRHCAIVIHPGAASELHDSGSRNGTYLNGLKVSGCAKLVSGDVIWICHRRFVFVSKTGDSA